MNRRSLIKSLALIPLAMVLPACKPRSCPPCPELPDPDENGVCKWDADKISHLEALIDQHWEMEGSKLVGMGVSAKQGWIKIRYKDGHVHKFL